MANLDFPPSLLNVLRHLCTIILPVRWYTRSLEPSRNRFNLFILAAKPCFGSPITPSLARTSPTTRADPPKVKARTEFLLKTTIALATSSSRIS